MRNQISPSRRLTLLISGVWLFLSGIFSAVIGSVEFFSYFDTISSFFVTWLFVGVMPLALLWGTAWVVRGYRRGHHQEVFSEQKSSNFEAGQQTTGSSYQHFQNINYHKGLWRLWVVGTIAWLSYAFISSDHQIGEWIGFHYSLLVETKSFTGAAKKKQNYKALVAACNKAQVATCWVPAHQPDPNTPFPEREYLPDCEKTSAFRETLSSELRVRGIDIPASDVHGEACPDILAADIPTADWGKALLTIVAPFFLVITFLIGRWIINGFIKRF